MGIILKRAGAVGLLLLTATFTGCTLESCCGPKPPPPPPPPTPGPTIELQDAFAGVWMTIHNDEKQQGNAANMLCAADDPNTAWDEVWGSCENNWEARGAYRGGVLFQFGKFIPSDDYETRPASENLPDGYMTGITIELNNGGVEELEPGDFDWLDIRPVGGACVIEPIDAYAMFHTKPDRVLTECDAAKAVDAAGGTLPISCLRDRSLHAYLAPERIITFWPGRDYYTMRAAKKQPAPNAVHYHVNYTFEAAEPISVDRWLGGCMQGQYADVKRVLIKYGVPDSAHNQFHGPPMNGGGLSKSP